MRLLEARWEAGFMKRTTLVVLAIVLAAAASLSVEARKKKKTAEQPSAPAPAAAAAPAPAADKAAAVAYVQGVMITMDDLDALVGSRLAQIHQQEYELRRAALEQAVSQKLLEAEAQARGIPLEELVKTEIEDKVPDPTTEEVDAFYKTNQNRLAALKGKSREDAGPQIEQMLKQQKLVVRRNEFVSELRKKADVRILLDAPRVDVPIPQDEPSMGPADAPVTIVEFSDYQCPYCKRAEATVDRLLAEYKDKIRFVYRDFPLRFHSRAMPASLAARCAGEQDKYWQFHDNLFKVAGDLSDADLTKRAQDLSLDAEQFKACFQENRQAPTIQASMQDASSVGVTGTPTFFVNGRMIVGAKPYEDFKSIVEEELERAKQRSEASGS
jgi:protein-disulfide isomerase